MESTETMGLAEVMDIAISRTGIFALCEWGDERRFTPERRAENLDCIRRIASTGPTLSPCEVGRRLDMLTTALAEGRFPGPETPPPARTFEDDMLIAAMVTGDDGPLELTAHLQSSVKELGGPRQVAVNRAWVRRVAEGTPIPADWKASDEAIELELQALEAEGVPVAACPRCGG